MSRLGRWGGHRGQWAACLALATVPTTALAAGPAAARPADHHAKDAGDAPPHRPPGRGTTRHRSPASRRPVVAPHPGQRTRPVPRQAPQPSPAPPSPSAPLAPHANISTLEPAAAQPEAQVYTDDTPPADAEAPRRHKKHRRDTENEIDSAAETPIRSRRFIALAAELGLNTLSGAGLSLHWTPIRHLGVSIGGGYNVRGPRLGAMLRGELLTRHATPFLGLGLAYDFGTSIESSSSSGSLAATGSDGVSAAASTLGTSQRITVGAGLAMQVVGGVSLVTESGFFLLSTAGYAVALTSNNSALGLFDLVSSGGPFGDFFAASGPVMGVALGYAF